MNPFARFSFSIWVVASLAAAESPQPSAPGASVIQNDAETKIVTARARDIDISDYGALGDGKNDDAAALQRAIDAAAATGGGAAYVKRMALAGNTVALGSTITLKQKVILKPDPGIIMKWTGAAGGTMFTTGAGQLPLPVSQTGFEGYGVTIDPNASSNPAGTIFDVNAAQDSVFAGLQILDASPTAIGFHLRADVREPAYQNRNCTRTISEI